MLNVIFSPAWFYGKDIIIDIVSILVLLLVAFFSIRSYPIKKNRKYIFLALSFFMIAVSFLFKILMNFSIYYHVIETKQIGALTLTLRTVEVTNTLFVIGYFAYRLLMVLGFYLLYSLYKPQCKYSHILAIYLIIVSVYFSQSAYHIFHLTLLILLTLITIIYSRKHIIKDIPATKLLAASFCVIALSQLFFILIKATTLCYVIAEFVQLAGYIGLLITFIMVLKHARKKDKN